MTHTCHKKSWGSVVAWTLVVIGALNWGLVGIGNFAGGNWNIVDLITGRADWLASVIYILVALSALWLLFAKKCCTSQCTCAVSHGKGTSGRAQHDDDMGGQMMDHSRHTPM